MYVIANLKLKTLPRRIAKDKVTTIGHVFRPNFIEQQSKLFHLRYSPKDDCYYQLGSNTAIVKGWRNGTNVAVNIMRRIGKRADIDLQWAYLSRYPGRQSGSISWKVDFSDSGLVVDDVTALTYSRTSPGGLIRYDIVSPDVCLNDGSTLQGDSNDLSGLKTLILVAYLDGIKTNQTQTQLLYHEWSTKNEELQKDDTMPFEIIIKLKADENPKCTCPQGDPYNKQLKCTCLKKPANHFIPKDCTQLCHCNHGNKSRSEPSLVDVKYLSNQSAHSEEEFQDGVWSKSKQEHDSVTKKSFKRFGYNELQYDQSKTEESFNDNTGLNDTNTNETGHTNASRPKFPSSRSETNLLAPVRPHRSIRTKFSKSESKLHDVHYHPNTELPEVSVHFSKPNRLPPLQQPIPSSPIQSPHATKRKPRKRLKITTKTTSSPSERRCKKPTHNERQELCRSHSAPLNQGFIDDDISDNMQPPSASPSPSKVKITNSFATMSVIETEEGATGGVCSVQTKKVLFTKEMHGISLGWDGDANRHTDGRKIDKEALVTIDCSGVEDSITPQTRNSTCQIL